jgi:hypothetical protein
MSNVNAEIKMQGNNDAWFTTNAAVVYPANVVIYHTDGRYKYTDGVTALSALTFRGAGGSATWGGITGTLSNQTDLQTVLNNKEPLKGSDDNYVTDAQLVVISNTSGTNTGNETAATIGAIVNGATNYTPPLDADKIGIWDVANSLFKALTWANLKVALSSIFAPLNSVVDITSLCTITGWASFTTCVVTRIDLGNAYLVNVYISGVSNSGTASVQLDFTSSINAGNISYAVSNGTGVNGRVLIAAGSNTIDWRASVGGTSFAATGTKLISGQLWFPKP